MNPTNIISLADIGQFDEIIDVRSPAEFAEDHIPGAISCPVLDNDERARVGTLYTQVSPFEAKKLGGALIAQNIGRHLQERFLDRGKDWKPLIYCWRGGMRSGAMVTILRAVGWRAGQLAGGYKTYRRHVVDALDNQPGRFTFKVLCGATGNAKTRILQAIAHRGGQVLDLETLACHKGSVLGVLPDQPQPSQKWFETRLLEVLSGFSPEQPVYVEAESRKIGQIHIPDALLSGIRGGQCCLVEASTAARVNFLLTDYDYYLRSPPLLKARLAKLHGLQSNETLARWNGLIDSGDWPRLVEELLTLHYDPLYRRSQGDHYAGAGSARRFATANLSVSGIAALAEAIHGA